MTQSTTRLEEALEAWGDARRGVIDEVRNIPAKQWDFRPTPDVKSVRELAVHILEVAMLMTGELTRTDTNFRRAPWLKLLRMYAGSAYKAKSRTELQRILRLQLKSAQREFRSVGELHMLQLIERFDGEKGTRLAWLYHGIAQEEYHRGQLTVYERLMGIEPALTRRIRGG
ncbi:MAG: DinB family protein [Candidatus Krumholzibacteria bacterium]|nr:DinB family protein [Candidatus Krumholzibacteria bacterium]